MDINLMNGNFCSAEQYHRALEEAEKEKKQQKIEKQELQTRSDLREFLLKKSIWNFLRKRNSALSVVPR